VLLAALAAALAAASAPPASAADPRLTARILPILHAAGMGGPGTAVAVVDLDSGQTVFQLHPWRQLLPASNEKLLTSVTALQTLRPGFRFTTRVVGSGQRSGATWDGDLYLVGGGDPTFSTAEARILARRIRAMGIRHVTGGINGDETVFDAARTGPDWKRGFAGFESPPLSGLAIDRDVNARGAAVWTPARAAARTLRRTLEHHGVTVGRRRPFVGQAPLTATPLTEISSVPLFRILRYMDRQSDNFTAEMVLKEIGAVAGTGGTTAAGIAVEKRVVGQLIGSDFQSLAPLDGSGLSSGDRATAGAFVKLLARMDADPMLGPTFRGLLAVGGRNGTLEHRLSAPAVRGRIVAKTGTLDQASSLSGYATSLTGHRYAFSILMNSRGAILSSWTAQRAQDAIASLLVKRF
jgi:D-alanyl-D-alanine carboxypeptidase/D-alanyl-D-alanine-endopeptidase (penicillin-binding protein 4)